MVRATQRISAAQAKLPAAVSSAWSEYPRCSLSRRRSYSLLNWRSGSGSRVCTTVGRYCSSSPASTSTSPSYVYEPARSSGEPSATTVRSTSRRSCQRLGSPRRPRAVCMAVLRKTSSTRRAPSASTSSSARWPPARVTTDLCHGVNRSRPSSSAYAWRSPWWRAEEYAARSGAGRGAPGILLTPSASPAVR
ncbi:hypothetical protein SCALM49S_02990 [Streptomyces californicus]